MILRWLFSIPARRRADQSARDAAQVLEPSEPIWGSVIVADEPERFVVRVFMGHEPKMYRVPPWKLCLVLGVSKSTFEARPEPDEKYLPILR